MSKEYIIKEICSELIKGKDMIDVECAYLECTDCPFTGSIHNDLGCTRRAKDKNIQIAKNTLKELSQDNNTINVELTKEELQTIINWGWGAENEFGFDDEEYRLVDELDYLLEIMEEIESEE